MRNNFVSFWLPGILSAIIISIFLRYQLLQRFEFINDLISEPSMPGLVALIVLLVVVWSLLSMLFRNRWAAHELSIIRISNTQLNRASLDFASLFRFTSQISQQYKSSLLNRRFGLISQGQNGSEKISTLLGGQSGVDSAFLNSDYGPLRALIWALPGLGFMGTASEMASSVSGLSTALATTQDYGGLRNLLVNNVVPHLAGAFNITLFALGSSVLMFLLMSLEFHFEEQAIYDADMLCLRVISRTQETQSANSIPAGYDNLILEMKELGKQFNSSSAALSQINQSDGILLKLLNSMNTAMLDIAMKIERVENNLRKDEEFIIKRVPH